MLLVQVIVANSYQAHFLYQDKMETYVPLGTLSTGQGNHRAHYNQSIN
jgi:hypothetical protein